MDDLNFDLLIEDHGLQLSRRVVASSAGESPRSLPLELGLDSPEFVALLGDLEHALLQSNHQRHLTHVRASSDAHRAGDAEDIARAVGRLLFEKLLGDDIATLYVRSRRDAEQRG